LIELRLLLYELLVSTEAAAQMVTSGSKLAFPDGWLALARAAPARLAAARAAVRIAVAPSPAQRKVLAAMTSAVHDLGHAIESLDGPRRRIAAAGVPRTIAYVKARSASWH
jgi:hypothetical protein